MLRVMICYFMYILCYVYIMRVLGCKRRKEMEFSYKVNKEIIYLF